MNTFEKSGKTLIKKAESLGLTIRPTGTHKMWGNLRESPFVGNISILENGDWAFKDCNECSADLLFPIRQLEKQRDSTGYLSPVYEYKSFSISQPNDEIKDRLDFRNKVLNLVP